MSKDDQPQVYGSQVAAVVIGRNEGQRLVACLHALRAAGLSRVVYVDSGSTDGSVAAAHDAKADVVALDMSKPFTAARGRNAGLAALGFDPDGNSWAADAPDFIQFIDGDCELHISWISHGVTFLTERPDVAVCFGRLREKHPEHSVYNRLCDAEWADIPLGSVKAGGGIMVVRRQALEQSGAFNDAMIAGEESELCIRIRAAGWLVWRLDAEMALHDAAMTKFSQFWKRGRRSGYALAEGVAMNGRAPERHRVAGVRRVVFWAVVVPLLLVLGLFTLGSAALFLLLIYPVQAYRVARTYGGNRLAWERTGFQIVGQFAESQGIGQYLWQRFKRRSGTLIEYK